MGQQILEAFQYILSFGPTVMLPIVVFILAICFRVKPAKALRSSVIIGMGFVGIFLIFNLLIESVGPAAQAMVDRTGIDLPVVDTGWPPLAAIAFASPIAPFVIPMVVLLNIAMIMLRWTKTVDIDLWNYWHFAFAGALVYSATGNFFLGLLAAAIATVTILKMADWSAPYIQKRFNLPGISLPTLSAVIFFPVGVLGNKIIGSIPGVRNLKADPDSIQKRFGVFGEPMMIGLILGIIIGILAGYDADGVLKLGMNLGAVMLIMPRMVRILMEGLIPLSDAIRALLKKRFPDRDDITIGLDIAVAIGNPAVISTALLMTPITILLAVILPGNKIIPLGDLSTLTVPMAMIVLACGGNIIRSIIIGIPVIIANLYIASYLAPLVTQVAKSINFQFPEGASELVNSFLDGGNPFRYWMVMLSQGNIYAIGAIPVVGLVIWSAYKITKKDFDENGKLKDVS
ncbi:MULTISPECIES: PTS galactitol transporter subunit IIC [Bacillaceae]|uniref:PTS galactitol transporter subunit IIC n=1 Tax=Bacillaceae TaxID=186817 RepID=UPI000C331E7E|nr:MULTISPECIES: PTS transporter subunit IIC [Bacillaceae]MEB2629308.1 PTS transporter subunit IIC [Peribacillus frigoritolerans]PKF90175.1 PTS galactitol transporter subunit IIC [Bacillus sp. BA3]